MNARKAFFIASAASMCLNWVFIPHGLPSFKEHMRQKAIERAEMFADNLRGLSANQEPEKHASAMPPKVSIEQLLRYED